MYYCSRSRKRKRSPNLGLSLDLNLGLSLVSSTPFLLQSLLYYCQACKEQATKQAPGWSSPHCMILSALIRPASAASRRWSTCSLQPSHCELVTLPAWGGGLGTWGFGFWV